MDDFTVNQLVIFAARSGNLELLKSRIEAGGDVNYIDKKHGAALIVAIMSGNIEVLEILLSNNANVNIEYRDCIGPLEIALGNPNINIVYRLVCAGAKLKHTTRPYYRERLIQCLKEIKDINCVASRFFLGNKSGVKELKIKLCTQTNIL